MIPWTVAHQVSLSMEFSRQEYWSGLPFFFPGDLHNPGMEPRSPALQADSLPSEPPGKISLYLGQKKERKKECEVAKSCPTLYYPMDCLPGSSVHGIFEAKFWNRLPFPLVGDLPDLGSNLGCRQIF